jgi:hypothetical protein
MVQASCRLPPEIAQLQSNIPSELIWHHKDSLCNLLQFVEVPLDSWHCPAVEICYFALFAPNRNSIWSAVRSLRKIGVVY